MVAIKVRAHFFGPEICADCGAKKNNSDSLHCNRIFSYTHFTDFSIPVGGISDV